MGKKNDPQIAERTAEVRENARELAETSSKAFNEFAGTTGAAAKDFAHTALEAAKDLVDTVEQASGRLGEETEKSGRKSRKLLKATLALGAGAVLFGNERVRNFVGDQVRRLRGEPAEPWTTTTTPTAGDGAVGEPTSTTTP